MDCAAQMTEAQGAVSPDLIAEGGDEVAEPEVFRYQRLEAIDEEAPVGNGLIAFLDYFPPDHETAGAASCDTEWTVGDFRALVEDGFLLFKVADLGGRVRGGFFAEIDSGDDVGLG